MKRIIVWLVNVIDHVVCKQDKIVLRGYPDVEDQCLSVLIALARRDYSGKVIWLMRSVPPGIHQLVERHGLERLRLKICPRSSLWALFHFVTARTVLFTHGIYSQGDWGNYDPPRSKTVVNMWHGMPIKTIWRFMPQAIEPPRSHVLLATSPRFQQIMADVSGMKIDQIWALGLPRNDLLHYRSPHAETSIRELVGECPWFLYLPTYRKSKEGYLTEDGCEHDSVLSMSNAETRELDNWLRESGTRLIVKAHPMSVHAGLCTEQRSENIIVISENWLIQHQLTLYGLAGYSTGMITDLSSIAVDYLLLGNPVFIYFPDRAKYEQGRGTVFDNLEENLPGEICEDVVSLIAQMDSYRKGQDLALGKRTRLLSEWHAFTTGSAADRLLDSLNV